MDIVKKFCFVLLFLFFISLVVFHKNVSAALTKLSLDKEFRKEFKSALRD